MSTIMRRRDGPIPVIKSLSTFQIMEKVAEVWNSKQCLQITDLPRLPRKITNLDTAIIVLAHATVRFFKIEEEARKAKSEAEAKAMIENAGFNMVVECGIPEKGSVLAGVLRLLRKMNVVEIDEERRLVMKLWRKMRKNEAAATGGTALP